MRQTSRISVPEPAQAVNPEGIAGDLPAFLRHLRRNPDRKYSEKTVTTYRQAVERLALFLAARRMPETIEAISGEHVREFIAELMFTRSPATAANRFRSLQAFFKWAQAEGYIKQSPMAGQHPPRIPDQPVPVIGHEERKALLAACRGKNFEDRRDEALIRFMFDTGLRIGEVLKLSAREKDVVNALDMREQLAVIVGKGGRRRTVHFGDETGTALDRYLRLRRQHPDHDRPELWLGRRGPLTDQGLRLVIRRRGEQAGLGRIWPHQLRHTSAHLAKTSGMSSDEMMHFFGWRDQAMVARYAASTGEERALATHKRLAWGDKL